MGGVGIVGVGISGVQLALRLQQHGVQTCLYSAEPVDGLPSGAALNYAFRWGPTVDRERSLGLEERQNPCQRLRVRGPLDSGIDFTGTLPAPGDGTDFRDYLPRLIAAYEARGGELRVEPCAPRDLPGLLPRHDLLVVAAGRGYGEVFGVDSTRSPRPQVRRTWTVGVYRGLDLPPGSDIEMNLLPGSGEIFHMRYLSRGEVVPVLGIGATPGGPIDLPRTTVASELAAAAARVLRDHAPHVHARLDASTFAPRCAADVIHAPISPVVREAWTSIDGRPVMALGDAWILNDPLAAQGANLGSRCAFTLADAVLAGGPYDQAFAQHVGDLMWEQAEAPWSLSNALLDPPPPHVMDLLGRASHDQALADAFADGFGHPEQMLQLLTPADVSV